MVLDLYGMWQGMWQDMWQGMWQDMWQENPINIIIVLYLNNI